MGKRREAGTPEKMGWCTAREDGEDVAARGDEWEGWGAITGGENGHGPGGVEVVGEKERSAEK